jgi:hypothetical protein
MYTPVHEMALVGDMVTIDIADRYSEIHRDLVAVL